MHKPATSPTQSPHVEAYLEGITKRKPCAGKRAKGGKGVHHEHGLVGDLLYRNGGYKAFSATASENGSLSGSVTYNGKAFEEFAELCCFDVRWYAPVLGRSSAEDPIRGGNNWFAYCGINPMSFTDPTGLTGIRLHQDSGSLDVEENYDATVDVSTGKIEYSFFGHTSRKGKNKSPNNEEEVANDQEQSPSTTSERYQNDWTSLSPDDAYDYVLNYADEFAKSIPLYVDVSGGLGFLSPLNLGPGKGFFLNAWGIYEYNSVSANATQSPNASLSFGVGRISKGYSWGASAAATGVFTQTGPGFVEVGIGTSGAGISGIYTREVISWRSINEITCILQELFR